MMDGRMDGSPKPYAISPQLSISAKSLAGNWTPKITVPLLILQASMVMVLSYEAVSSSSEIGDDFNKSSLIPSSLPLLSWFLVSSIRKRTNYRHIIGLLPQISLGLTVVGLILVSIFYTTEEEALFLPSFYLLIISASAMFMSVSENMDDSGFNWVDLVSTLMDGAANKEALVMAIVPVLSKGGTLEFRGSSKIKRRNVHVELDPGFSAVESRTQMLGYLLKNRRSREWHPATLGGLYSQASLRPDRGFSMGAAKLLEKQSLGALMISSFSDPETRWETCSLQNLISGNGVPIYIKSDGNMERLNHRWTEEEIQYTANMIVNSIPESGANLEAKMRSDWATLLDKLDVNDDGKVNVWDFFDLLFPGGMKEEKIPLQESVEFLLLGGDSEFSTIDKYLLMAHLTCLSSFNGTRGGEISPIAWREMCSFFPILAKQVIERIEEEKLGNSSLKDEERGKIEQGRIDDFRDILKGAVERPAQQFADSHDSLLKDLVGDNPPLEERARTFFKGSLGLTTSVMLDRIDAMPSGITPGEKLEKRKGSVIAASMILEVLLLYNKCFQRRN